MESVIKKAKEELCHKDNDCFSADDLSVVFTYFLHEKIHNNGCQNNHYPDISLHDIAKEFIKHCQEIQFLSQVDLNNILSDKNYLLRLKEIVKETMSCSDSNITSLRISSKKLSAEQYNQFYDNCINFGLVFFAESIHFQNTVHAFQNDTYNIEKSLKQVINVFGIRQEWLTDNNKITRALIVDETGLIKDVIFAEPVKLDFVQILHLPRKNEIELHKKLSKKLNTDLIQINPYSKAVEIADDKMLTYKLKNSVEMPQSLLIFRADSHREIDKKLKNFLSKLTGNIHKPENVPRDGYPVVAGFSLRYTFLGINIVVQPNKGTEGKKVKFFSVDTEISNLVDYLTNHIFPEDDALIRQERGNVRYFSTEEENLGHRRISLRVNVAYNGRDFIAESGYAQVSMNEQSMITSLSAGGKIIHWDDALRHLYCFIDRGWRQIKITEHEIDKIKSTAVNTARILNNGLDEVQYLKFLGIDIVLESTPHAGHAINSLVPIVLEANPRPAGLSQSNSINCKIEKKSKLMISDALFEYMSRSGLISLDPEGLGTEGHQTN